MRFRAYVLAAMAPPPMPIAEESDPWIDLEWHQHPAAIRAVAQHPEGMTLEQIGRLMGVTRERVRQIESTALRKLIDCTGAQVIEVGRHTFAIPDCERCSQPFIRRIGRDRHCEACKKLMRKRRRVKH